MKKLLVVGLMAVFLMGCGEKEAVKTAKGKIQTARTLEELVEAGLYVVEKDNLYTISERNQLADLIKGKQRQIEISLMSEEEKETFFKKEAEEKALREAHRLARRTGQDSIRQVMGQNFSKYKVSWPDEAKLYTVKGGYKYVNTAYADSNGFKLWFTFSIFTDQEGNYKRHEAKEGR